MATQIGSARPAYAVGESSLDLRSYRQRKEITLEQIAERTKISIRFLRAIEAGEFDKLPGGIFATSYLRQYAGQIGLEESKLLAAYQKRTAPGSAEPVVEVAVKKPLVRFWRTSATQGR